MFPIFYWHVPQNVADLSKKFFKLIWTVNQSASAPPIMISDYKYIYIFKPNASVGVLLMLRLLFAGAWSRTFQARSVFTGSGSDWRILIRKGIFGGRTAFQWMRDGPTGGVSSQITGVGMKIVLRSGIPISGMMSPAVGLTKHCAKWEYKRHVKYSSQV